MVRLGRKSFNPVQYLRNIDPTGVANPSTVIVGYIGINSEYGIGFGQEIGAAGIAESGAAFIAAGVQRQAHKLGRVHEFPGNQFARGVQTT